MSNLGPHVSDPRTASLIEQYQANTLAALQTTIRRSTLAALPDTMRSPGWEHMAGRFTGKPAVVIGAGPSLERNLGSLAPYADQMVLFAGARAAPLLERYGIQPHLLVHAEAQDYYHLIEGRHFLREAFFLLADQCERRYHQHGQRGTFIFHSNSNPVTRWVTACFPELQKQIGMTSGSVTTSAFHMACLAGCNPIILIGQDLAIQGERLYAGSWTGDRDDARRGRLLAVPGYFGGEVTTFEQLLVTRHWYEQVIPPFRQANPHIKLINATEGGAAIPHFENMKLADACRRYAAGPGGALEIMATVTDNYQPGVSPTVLTDALKRLNTQLHQVAGLAKDFSALARKFNGVLAGGVIKPRTMAELQKLMPKLNNINQRMLQMIQRTPGLGAWFERELQGFAALQAMVQKRGGDGSDARVWVNRVQHDLKHLTGVYSQAEATVRDVLADL